MGTMFVCGPNRKSAGGELPSVAGLRPKLTAGNPRVSLSEFKSKSHVGLCDFLVALLDKPARLPWQKKDRTLSLQRQQ
jgi:hypothetical protein